jgi:hypothetical protein
MIITVYTKNKLIPTLGNKIKLTTPKLTASSTSFIMDVKQCLKVPGMLAMVSTRLSSWMNSG